MSRDWRWFDRWREGDDEAFSRSLAEETDKSLARDPDRWPSRKVEETIDGSPSVTPYRAGHGHHGKTGKGGQQERHGWSDADYAAAREDYQRQNPPSERPYQPWPDQEGERR